MLQSDWPRFSLSIPWLLVSKVWHLTVCVVRTNDKKKKKHEPVLLQFEPLVDSDRSNYKCSQFKDDGRFGLLLNQFWHTQKNELKISIDILVSLSQFSLFARSILLVNGTNRYVMPTDNSRQSCNYDIILADMQ